MEQASCRHRPDLDWFDLDCNLEACINVCATCPVGDRCLDYAIEHDCREGIWSGEWGYRLNLLVRQRGGVGNG